MYILAELKLYLVKLFIHIFLKNSRKIEFSNLKTRGKNKVREENE